MVGESLGRDHYGRPVEFLEVKDQTRLNLTHDGFERLPDGEEQRKSYDHGSADLLGKFKIYVEKG